jgi:hypothetical protein
MVITRLKLSLEPAEYAALLKVAGDELRNPIDQVRFMLRQELERRGLLVLDTETSLVNDDVLPAQEPNNVEKYIPA